MRPTWSSCPNRDSSANNSGASFAVTARPAGTSNLTQSERRMLQAAHRDAIPAIRANLAVPEFGTRTANVSTAVAVARENSRIRKSTV